MNDLGMTVTNKDKEILKSFAPLAIVIILFVLVGKFGISQVLSLRDQNTAAKASQAALSDKLKILQSVSQSPDLGANSILFALPKSNPSLSVITQLQLLSSQEHLVLSDLKSSVGNAFGSSDVLSTSTVFKVSGTLDQIMAFTKDIEAMAPITFVSKMSLVEGTGLIEANVTVQSYYAPLPKNISAVGESIKDLTTSEKALLSQINQLNRPALDSSSMASVSGTNANPFGQ